jgi:3-oxoacyl-[acyl-carrier protein] reductase
MLCFLASKGAVEQISRVLAKDLGAKGITVNTVSPGPLDTAQFREGKSQKWIDFFSKQSPSNRLGLPEDVAPLVAFLSSPAAQWINGQNIRVNGVSLIFFCNTYPPLTIWIGFGIVTIARYTVYV